MSKCSGGCCCPGMSARCVRARACSKHRVRARLVCVRACVRACVCVVCTQRNAEQQTFTNQCTCANGITHSHIFSCHNTHVFRYRNTRKRPPTLARGHVRTRMHAALHHRIYAETDGWVSRPFNNVYFKIGVGVGVLGCRRMLHGVRMWQDDRYQCTDR